MNFIILLVMGMAMAQGPSKSFSLLITRKYDKSFYKVYSEKEKIICVTESFPYFEASADPLKDLDWKKLEEEEEKLKSECKLPVAILDERSTPTRKVVTCFGQSYTTALIERLSSLCKSEI